MQNKLKTIHLHAAAIDIGADKIYVCAQDDGYKTFGCFTEDFKKTVQYIKVTRQQ